MKNLLVFTFCSFSLFLSTLTGQASFMPKIGGMLSGYRFPAGTAENDLVLGEFYDAQVRKGYFLGVAVDIPLKAGLSIQPEVLYVQKGSNQISEVNQPISITFDEPIIFEDGTGIVGINSFDNIEENLNYIELPLLLKYTFLGGVYGFYANVGPVLSIGISGESTTTLTDVDGNTQITPELSYNELVAANVAGTDFSYPINFGTSASDHYSRLDIGWAIGGGMYIELGKGKLNLDLRYTNSFTNMFDDQPRDKGLSTYINEEQFNNTISFSIGYAIPLSGGYALDEN